MEHDRGLRVVLLGAFEVIVGGRTVEPSAWRLGKAKDLVKILALSPERRLLRDQVLEILWPGRDPDSASNNLHQVLHAARQAVSSAGGEGRSCLILKSGAVHLCPNGALEIDADEFEAAARTALASGTGSDYQRALDLYAGELLPDDRYADWARDRRDTLQRLKTELMAGLASRLEENGHLTAAAQVLERLILDDSTNEAAHRALMRVRARAGDRTAAIRQYQVLERVLADELGVAPDPRSMKMFEAVRSGAIGPPDDEGWDPGPPTNLGQPLSSFVGREQELAELAALIRGNRLVTLVGAGGCGKTRLAQEVGRRELQHFSGGVYLVELAPVSQPRGVARQAMRTLDVRRGPEETEQHAICKWVKARTCLLIFDNCEHLADEAGILISALLESCPRLRVLTTSREPLRVPGEVVRRVSSLPVPDPDQPTSLTDLRSYDAVALFAERAQAVQAGFEVDDTNAADIAAVCTRLDGLPLALELAAARVPTLGVSGLASNLDDRFRILTQGPPTAPTHQRTLEATVEWSFDLLSEDEKSLFAGLSVFNGPFDLDAVRAIAAPSLGDSAASLVSRLVDRSVVLAEGTDSRVRYRLLETLREYGQDRLRSTGELGSARTRHARWLQQLVGSSQEHATSFERAALISKLNLAHDDLGPALSHLLETAPGEAARLASRAWPYWLWRSHLGEGLSVIERVLERVTGPSSERADLLIGAAALSFRWKGFAEMERYVQRSRREAAALGDVDRYCQALIFAAAAPFNRDDFDTSRTLFGQALELARTHDRQKMEISARLCLAMLAASRLDFSGARTQLDRAEPLASGFAADTGVLDLYTLGAWMPTRRRGERLHMHSETFLPFEDGMGRPAQASIALARGNLERLTGRLNRSASQLETALRVSEHVGDEAGEALALSWMGQLALDREDYETAEHHLTKSLRIRRRILHLRGVVTSLISLARLATERTHTHTARRHLQEAEDVCHRRIDRVGTAQVLSQRAQVEMASGNPGAAAAGLADAVSLWRTLGYGIAIACALRDLGEAQLAAGMQDQARATLAEANEIFQRNGYLDEARRCRRLSLAAVG